jgi:hypothetical protein
VRIEVGFSPDSALTALERAGFLRDLETLIRERVGAMWVMEVTEVTPPAPTTPHALARLTAQILPALEADPLPDKRFLLTVASRSHRGEIAGREWDATARRLGPVQARTVYDAAALASAGYELLGRLFQPVLLLQSADMARAEAELRLQGGAFVPESVAADPNADALRAQLRPGDLVLPFIQYFEKDGSLRENQFLPWTYLIVESVERGRVKCGVVTGIRAPLGARQSQRVRTMGLAARPLHPATRMQLRLRRNEQRPLAAHTVLVASSPDLSHEPKSLLHEMFTDRQGAIELPASAEHPLVWVYVKSGSQLLAKLPYAPGLEASVAVDLPDDAVRLGVEGEIEQIKSRLVDAVARRAAVMIRARALAKAGNWDGVTQQFARLDGLPGRPEFRQQLDRIRLPALEATRQQQNRVAQRKINEQCDEVALLINRYLDPARIAQLREDIESLRP